LPYLVEGSIPGSNLKQPLQFFSLPTMPLSLPPKGEAACHQSS
jgi:hypothetical protein